MIAPPTYAANVRRFVATLEAARLLEAQGRAERAERAYAFAWDIALAASRRFRTHPGYTFEQRFAWGKLRTRAEAAYTRLYADRTACRG